MLAVGLVHRECRYQSKMATQVEKAKCVIWFIETHSATTVLRLYRNTHRKVPPTRKIIYAWRKQFEETGCLCKGKSPGRPRVADDSVGAVRRSYMRSPSKSTNRAPANRVEDSTQATKDEALQNPVAPSSIQSINRYTMNKTWDDILYRVDIIRVTNGAHIEHL
jgi:hypothetical protein